MVISGKVKRSCIVNCLADTGNISKRKIFLAHISCCLFKESCNLKHAFLHLLKIESFYGLLKNRVPFMLIVFHAN